MFLYLNICDVVKKKNDELVQKMLKNEEIPEKVAEYLVSELKNLSTFYHLLKTHKIPQDVENPSDWLESNGFPLRGIIRGSPPEKISGFVDIFLQPCMIV